MRCPHCDTLQNRVVDSRLSKDGRSVRRRRSCSECNRRFTTYERIEEYLPLVAKKDGSRESFDRNKVIAGLQKACEKRPVPMSAIEDIVDELERVIQEEGTREIAGAWIGEWVMDRLRDLDQVAYVRFASVYRQFRDITEFYEEAKALLYGRGEPAAEPASSARSARGGSAVARDGAVPTGLEPSNGSGKAD